MMGDGSARQFLVLSMVTLVTALTGGSSQATTPALALLRPVLALALVTTIMLPDGRDWRGLRAPATILALFALSMLLQLIPLPSRWWLGLAGHARYALAVEASGASALPLSLSPDLTLNSLFALMPAAVVIAAYAAMRPAHRWATAWLAAGVAGLSLIFAIGQIGGQGVGLYLYRGQQDYVAGLLANRNHQAVLLASALPVLAVLARAVIGRRHGRLTAIVLAGLAIVMLPMILLTGSRQGLALAALALFCAVPLLPLPAVRPGAPSSLSRRTILVALLGLVGALVVIALLSGRAASIERLWGAGGVEGDPRLLNWPTVMAMTRDFFPTGIGYGAFDPVHRGFEPDAVLNAGYFNHAHNDLLEVVLTGGLPGALLAVSFVGFLIARGAAVFGRDAATSRRSAYLDRAGLIVTVLFLLASLVDYPLRAPIVDIVVALAVCWLAAPPELPVHRARRSRERSGARLHARATA